MSGYQIYESTKEDGFTHMETPSENPPVIASIPDLDSNLYPGESNHLSTTTGQNARQLSVPKVAVSLTVAATVLVAGWIIFGDSNNAVQESWQQTPPAASAPEAPLWNAEEESKTAAIKLDEVTPQWTADTTSSTENEDTPDKLHVDAADEKASRVAAKPSTSDIRPRVSANRPLVIATPVPPARPVDTNRDWSTLDESEYYWAVRQSSTPTINARNPQHGNNTAGNYQQPSNTQGELAMQNSTPVAKPAYKTASRPQSGYHDSDLAAQRAANNPPHTQATYPQTAPAARLNGVITTPNARMY